VKPTHAELRAAVDDRLAAALDRAAGRVPDAELLIDELRRVVDAGGKRLRPAFCYWGFRAAGGEHGEPILRASASLELLHTFAVVHDDIMDESAYRRGTPTVNAKHGTSVALLAGDLALVLADEELVNAGFSPESVHRAFGAYSRMRQEVISGQFLELRVVDSPTISEADARRVAVLKSGRYSVREPLLVGALLADADDALLNGLGATGEALGEAFQIADDLLGTFGDERATGKPVDSDIRAGKKNLLYAKTVEMLSEPDLGFFRGAWGRGEELDEREVARLRQLVESSGARAAAEALAADLTQTAHDEIDALSISDEARSALLDLAARATDRER
jgi:geranylgeranyl diphosphate synthase type I